MLGNKVPTKTVSQAGNKIIKHISLWATIQTQTTFPKAHGHLVMSNALSSMWRGSESKLSQHCFKVRIQISSHLRAYSQLWVTVTSTIKLYTSNMEWLGASILTWKAENGRRIGNQDWTKAVWKFSRAHTEPCSSVHVLSPGYTETSSEHHWGWKALILCLCHLQHTWSLS